MIVGIAVIVIIALLVLLASSRIDLRSAEKKAFEMDKQRGREENDKK